MNTERIKIKQTEYCWVEFDLPLDILISDLQKCKEDGWEGIDIEYYGHDGGREYYLYKYREENDEEYAERMKAEKKQEEKSKKDKLKKLKKELAKLTESELKELGLK
jgi:hypothetical protein